MLFAVGESAYFLGVYQVAHRVYNPFFFFFFFFFLHKKKKKKKKKKKTWPAMEAATARRIGFPTRRGRLFGPTPLGWPRVQAICDFVHTHMTFGYEHSRPTRTAWDAYTERHGVCRDFAHLAVTFCRCLNIPARYCTGYITDIGTPPPYGPMDFAAWMEVYLGGRWHTFDPRNNAPRIGRILIAHGRDAADVPLTHIFGPGTLPGFRVWAEEASPNSSLAA